MTRIGRLSAVTLFAWFGTSLNAHGENAATMPPGLEPVAPPDIAPPRDSGATESRAASRAPSVSSLELFGTVGPSVAFGDAANPGYSPSLRRVGVFGELGVAYRSSYFVDPFLAVGYAPLASGDAQIPSGPWGAGGMLDQRLDIWTIAPGITADVWRLRLRAAIGFAVVVQRFRYAGEEHSSTQLPLSHQLGLGFNVLDVRRFRLDVEARYVGAPGADVTFLTFAAVLHGDVLEFASR